jgi:hypothetical protein
MPRRDGTNETRREGLDRPGAVGRTRERSVVIDALAERYGDNLDVLPGPTRETLARIAATAPEGAAFLAAHFATGRTQPRLVVQTLLQTEPSWLADLGADGWIAVANYADSHGVSEDAAAAYLRAAELSTDRSGP